ncbi:juvenile hormone acid O-methyltransferase-like [Photinus pyralis]|uniref:juvenile hormone acid O-methyltransferase-like n=1 Tax=Photinus pyralis TaxID=7054 RepID=UPI0012671447|nr:juvenile hormone acid O-methyltransferase-like [Photinus pyralis]
MGKLTHIPLHTKHEHQKDCQVLDVGCGTGNVTHDVLQPVLPVATREVIGIDRDRTVVEYASGNYGGRKLRFEQVDIVHDRKFVDAHLNYFDHIFSFSCLHFVREHTTALKHIREMLRPGGDFSFSCVTSNNFFKVVADMAQTEKWRPHIAHYENFMSPYQFSQNPMGHLADLLTGAGFRVTRLTIEPRETKVPLSYCPGMFISHLPMEIPTDLHHEFGLSVLKTIRELNLSCSAEDNKELFYCYFDAVFGHVTRPN